MSWYILQTLTNYEQRVEKYIKDIIGDPDSFLKGILLDVRVPTEEVLEVRNGKKRTVVKKFLPGYVLLEINMPERDWKNVIGELRRIQGVIGFVGYSNNVKPQPISQEEVRSIFQKSGFLKPEKKLNLHQEFSMGEEVRIVDGPFDTFSGIIDAVHSDKSKLTVMVGIFGRTTPVELDFSQVEKI